MSSSAKALEPAFQGAGQRLGTEIWRIENFQPVPLPKSDYGKFYSGDSYIVLQTSPGKGGAYLYDIHFWLGKDTSQDESGTAAIKTVELDAILGGRAVQHRELQGHESDKFLSYFKPCIIPLEGGIASGFKKPEEEEFETRLYVCKGKRVVRLKQVPFSRSSLNHDDVFILDTKDKIFQFNGANSNIQERAKALEVIQFLKDKYHEGTSDVAIVDDGKLDTESDSGEFWVIFGGFAPISKKVASEDDVIPEKTPPKLYSITDGQIKPADGELSKSMLENNKCYLLDCGAEVFVWVGRVIQVEDRKAATQAAEEFINSDNRPKSTRVTRIIQGYETRAFKSNFDSWPSGAVPSTGEEGRGKVAALLKQQGVGVKGMTKGAPVNEEVPPLLEGSGKIEVWRIDGSAKTPVPMEDIGKFYSGDCYIVLYTYHSGDKKEDFYLCCWIGKDSIEEDQKMATRLATNMFNSLKGRPVQGCIFQGKEPPQFIAIFQPMVVLKGGMSSGYKAYIADKGLNDETYTADCVALFRISGTSVHNNKTVQIDAVATSLNSNECFLLQSGSSIFTWHGNQSTFEQQQLASKVAEFLKPGVAVKFAKEGTENSSFWFALGGKQSYTSKKVTHEIVRDPHLFTFSFDKEGKFEVEEVYNFSQDDLLTEDVLILDTHAEVFVWVGQSVESKEKQSALEIGQKYIDVAASLEGLSPYVPLYKVMEGNEPCFFTSYFSWDPVKATAHGNSFQKKAMLLLGAGHAVESMASTSSEAPLASTSETPIINNSTKSKCSIRSLVANFKAKFCVSKPKPLANDHHNAASSSATTNKNDDHGGALSLSSKMIRNHLLFVDSAFEEAKKYMDHGGALFLSSNMIRNNLLLVDSAAFAEAKRYMDHLNVKINKAREKFEELQTLGGSLRDFDELQKDVAKLRLQISSHVKVRSADSNPHRKRWPNINEAEDAMSHFFYKEPEDMHTDDFDGLLKALHNLTWVSKYCLFCFFKFPPAAIIKRMTMIYLWIGLGLCTSYPWLSKANYYGNTIFDVLVEKGFIQPIYQKCSLVPDSCRMSLSVRSALYEAAKASGFTSKDNLDLDFQNDRGYRLGHTCLINVGEAIINWEPEIFDDIENIMSLYLGRWQGSTTHHIELADAKILHGLKDLKSLTFLSLRGISMITELPASILELKNLNILDLRACHNLEAIPDDIGLLDNLTHLDMSECYFLEHMPKSLAELSNLIVLKGFLIGDFKNNKQSCTLSNLSRLGYLRKLNIYVSVKDFHRLWDLDDLKYFELRKLTISWEGCSLHGESHRQSQEEATMELLKRGPLTLPPRLQKLDLQGFPIERLTDCLRPEQIKGLNKLYLRGGQLCDLGQSPEHQGVQWNVEILCLKYLRKLQIDWSELRRLFPKLIYLHQEECPKLTNSPCNERGVWMNMKASDSNMELQKYLKTSGMISSSSMSAGL